MISKNHTEENLLWQLLLDIKQVRLNVLKLSNNGKEKISSKEILNHLECLLPPEYNYMVGEQWIDSFPVWVKRCYIPSLFNTYQKSGMEKIKLGEKINLKERKRNILQLHDYYCDRIAVKMVANGRRKLQIPETPLKYLELPDNYKKLERYNEFVSEGKKQHNCVASYINFVENGKCMIFSATVNDERLTIEIRKTKTSFRISQCLKCCNERCLSETFKIVKTDVKNATENAYKKYNAIQKRRKNKELKAKS